MSRPTRADHTKTFFSRLDAALISFQPRLRGTARLGLAALAAYFTHKAFFGPRNDPAKRRIRGFATIRRLVARLNPKGQRYEMV